VAAENRVEDHPLIEGVLQRGYDYEFFQLVRLLHQLHPTATSIGHQGPVDQECIRFQPTAEMGFPASDIALVKRAYGPNGEPRFVLETTFLSLLGSQSPLPIYYTESYLQDDSDETLVKEFLDLFHHRLQSLFYRVWEKYRYQILFQPSGTDYYSKRLLSLIGLGSEILPRDFRVPAVRVLAYAGLLTQMPRSASALEGVLNDYFPGIFMRIEGCSPQWIPIEPSQLNRLGQRNCRLGRDLTVGERVYDRSCTFSAIVGPVGMENFMQFLPPGERLAEMRELVDLFNSDSLDYYVDLWIRRDEIPELKLSSPTALLGWTTWAGERPQTDQVVRFIMKGWLHGRR